MTRLSSRIDDIKAHYTVVVIGSGYGGGVAASRLARAGQDVCVLERGKEFFSGEFPNTQLEVAEETQYDLPDVHIGSETALFDYHINGEINVLVGCGLGGTSLINANVALHPDKRIFSDPRWPRAIVDDWDAGVSDGYRRAADMLKPTPYPQDAPPLKTLEAMERSARFMKQDFYRPPINVNFAKLENNVNHVGVEQEPCVLCGDCVTGCNHKAKNTTSVNYIPDARNHGAEIFTETSVRYLERQDDKWLVHYEVVGSGREKFDSPDMFVSADIVILGAGTLGTTEILLRSKQKGLSLSDMVGKHFSGNGDQLGFAYNNDQTINGVGAGTRTPSPKNAAGPNISGIIDTRIKAQDYKDGFSLEVGVLPGALAPILPISLTALAKLIGEDTDSGFMDYLGEKKREIESLVLGAYHGATNNTQAYLAMGHDSGDGEMKLEDDRLRISWPGVGNEEVFTKIKQRLVEATKALGGTFMPNPVWTELFGHDLITVHPLGGCVMGEDASSGAANHKGQVYSSGAGQDVHKGLYVADGAIIPAAVGTNPLFTISAIAERNMALLTEEYGWQIQYDLPSQPAEPIAPPKPGLQFTEKMTGYFSMNEKTDYQKAEQIGEKDNSPFGFTLTIISDDVEEMLNNPKHAAEMYGTVQAPALSPEPLTVSDGVFNLFIEDPNQVDTRIMGYRMKLHTEEGRDYYFKGFKTIRDDAGIDIWSDTTTLYVDVYDGENEQAELLGKGVLHIKPWDFVKQLTTVKINDVDSIGDRLRYTAEFGKFFAGVLFETYGGIFAGQNYFNPNAQPRKRRALRVSAPEVYDCTTADNVKIRLTRYKGGSKGPVLVSHGLGVSSKIFSIDTIDTNLLEYLFAHKYDVWLLDYRVSISLPAANLKYSADDVARYDYPAAVQKIREITGADSIQAVVHCFGSTAWTMAMLSGALNGVRSAVCSQVSTHMSVPLLTRIKTGLHVPTFLDKLGIDSLTAYVDKDSDWTSKFFDDALKLYPRQLEEQCNNPVCHRITFLYGHLYEHDQLNQETHDALHEMFGVANIDALEHLALMSRKGHIVTAQGADSYLPHLERLAIPITLISGGDNECFLPESTEKTYAILRENNGKALYRRFVIPNYGHIDCMFGKNAARDVFPHITDHLDATL